MKKTFTAIIFTALTIILAGSAFAQSLDKESINRENRRESFNRSLYR